MDSFFARLSLCFLAGGCLAALGAGSVAPLLLCCLTLAVAWSAFFGSSGSGSGGGGCPR